MKTYMNWSGGKDSALALYKTIQQQPGSVELLLTSVNKTQDRVSMHGVRRALLNKQAEAMGIPIATIDLPENTDMNVYNRIMSETTTQLYSQGFRNGIFGDIFLEDLRRYREEKMQESGLSASFPLWKQDTRQLAEEFIDLGFRAVVVCINEKWLDASFCGRELDKSFLQDLPENVDPCGENGEFHSFVFDGPIFRTPIPFTKGELVHRTYPAPKDPDQTCFTDQPEENNYGFYFQDIY